MCLIQEPPRYFVKRIPSGVHPLGEPEYDTCHRTGWSKIFFHTNVSVYLNEKILKTHSLFLFPSFDNNVIALTLQHRETGERFNYINCYNDPTTPTLQHLTEFLDREDLPHLILMGDFNLHSPKWDLEVEQADAKADTFFLKTKFIFSP